MDISDAFRLRSALSRYIDAVEELYPRRLRRTTNSRLRRRARRPDPVPAPDGLFYFPARQIRWTAHAGWGRRCHRTVVDGSQGWWWRGPFAQIDESWIGRLLTQTCAFHDDGRGAYAPPEWHRVPIDPSLIDRLPGIS